MPDLFYPLNDLNDWLQSEGLEIELFVIGAFALQLHGVIHRQTMDVDAIAPNLTPEVEKKIEEIGEKYGLASWLNDQASTIALPAGARERALLHKGFSHIKIFYAAREDLIKLKVAAYFYRREYELKDLDDLKALAPSSVEIAEGIQFLLQHHRPDIRKFADDFSDQVQSFERELRNELHL
jgi:hypothetical protein